MLSSQAAVAIENARLYEAATRWLKQLESLNEIASALASEVESSRVLELVASRLRELVHARLVLIALPVSDGATLVVRATDGEGAEELLGHAARARCLEDRKGARAAAQRARRLADRRHRDGPGCGPKDGRPDRPLRPDARCATARSG